MTTIPSKDIRTILVSEGLGVAGAASGWGIYRGVMPDLPNTVIAIFDITGAYDDNPKFRLDRPGINIQVRGDPRDYDGAFTKARAVYDALQGRTPATINTTEMRGIMARSGPYCLGPDDLNRETFSMNFDLVLEPDSGTYRTDIFP